jgi:RNA polymerase sigma-70 factor (ECF subfamily)
MNSPSSANSNRHADFVRLFVEHERQIYAYIRSLIPQRADAENVLQETAVVLWEKFDEYQAGTEFVRWAITVARFKVLSFHKQRRHDPIAFSDSLLESLDQVSAEIAQQPTDLQQALEDCLTRLDDADRELFRRRYQPGATVPKLAAELGRPVTTVYHALDRIRRALVACVERRLNSEGRS